MKIENCMREENKMKINSKLIKTHQNVMQFAAASSDAHYATAAAAAAPAGKK